MKSNNKLFGSFEYRQYESLLVEPRHFELVDDQPRPRGPENINKRVSFPQSLSQFGEVAGYDPLDHAYLSATRDYQFIFTSDVRYRETGGHRTLSFQLHLNDVGKRAMKLAHLNSVYWWEGKVDLRPTLKSINEKLSEREIDHDFLHAILATDETWLSEARDLAMVELMKRVKIDDLFVLPPRPVYVMPVHA